MTPSEIGVQGRVGVVECDFLKTEGAGDAPRDWDSRCVRYTPPAPGFWQRRPITVWATLGSGRRLLWVTKGAW
jgi:hypothetical protein